MKPIMLLGAFVLLAFNISIAQGGKDATSSNKYFVKSPHTHEQCMSVLMTMKEKGDEHLSKFYFGCKSGDHTSYAFLHAESEDAARMMIPAEIRETSKIVKVDKFNSDQISKMHDMMHEKAKKGQSE